MNESWVWILVLTGSAALASALGAVLLSLLGERRLVGLLPTLVAFSTGVMLATACLELLPEAFGEAVPLQASRLGLTITAGILFFFVLEKFIHVHHAHDVAADANEYAAENRATTVMVLTGTSLHNFIAGVMLAAAVLVDVNAALVLFGAITIHHIVQQVGDFSVLMVAGYGRLQALALTLASSAALFVGGVIAFVLLRHGREALPFIMALAAASLIYVALADLVPRLRSDHGWDAVDVIVPVAVGIGVVFAIVRLLPG